jgi:hypothetical protein
MTPKTPATEVPSEIPADLPVDPNGRGKLIRLLRHFVPRNDNSSMTFTIALHDHLRGQIPSSDGNQTSEGYRDQNNQSTGQGPLPWSFSQDEKNPYWI